MFSTTTLTLFSSRKSFSARRTRIVDDETIKFESKLHDSRILLSSFALPKIECLIYSRIIWNFPSSQAAAISRPAHFMLLQHLVNWGEVNSFSAEKSRPVKCSLRPAFSFVCLFSQTFTWTWPGKCVGVLSLPNYFGNWSVDINHSTGEHFVAVKHHCNYSVSNTTCISFKNLIRLSSIMQLQAAITA